MSNQIKALFSGMKGKMKDVEPNQGLGQLGEWPPAGEHDCYVLDCMMTEGTFRDGNGAELPAAVVQFRYELCEDTERETPLQWQGYPFTIPVDPSAIQSDGHRQRASIEMSRLLGHIKTLLGRDPSDDWGADLGEVEKLVQSDADVAVVVRCQYTQKGDRSYRTEFLQRLISG